MPIEPNVLYALNRGISLERSISWRRALRFALLSWPLCAAVCAAVAWFVSPAAISLTLGLSASIFALPLLFIPFFFLFPFLASKPRLLFRDPILSIEHKGRTFWSLDTRTPFFAAFLYRHDRSDALTLLQSQQSPHPLHLYGRHKTDLTLPIAGIPVCPFHLSLAALSLDQLDAFLMPDRHTLFLPPLARILFSSSGFQAQSLRLPLLRDANDTLRFDSTHLLWRKHNESFRKFNPALMSIQPFAYPSRRPKRLHLMFQIESSESSESSELPSLWIAVDWPSPLSLHHLPLASKSHLKQAIILSWLETLLLLYSLQQRGTLVDPAELFSHFFISPNTSN